MNSNLHRHLKRILLVVIFVLIITGGALVLTVYRVRLRDWWQTRNQEPVPVAVNRSQIVPTNNNRNIANTNSVPTTLPASVNLNVPFTSQAPNANWDQDHDEFCEEAAALMVGRYWQDRTIDGPSDAEAALQRIKAFELQEFGFYYDTTAQETATILEKLYDLKVEVVHNPTLDDIKRSLAVGRPVIVPTAGRDLGNPNFRSPGPVYHMLVLKGYTADGKIITNDAGTRKGADYMYDSQVILNAMHDWVSAGDRTKPGNGSATGDRVMIVVSSS